MYDIDTFRSNLDSLLGDSLEDRDFFLKLLVDLENTKERMYSMEGTHYHMQVTGVGLTPHGRRQALRVHITCMPALCRYESGNAKFHGQE